MADFAKTAPSANADGCGGICAHADREIDRIRARETNSPATALKASSSKSSSDLGLPPVSARSKEDAAYIKQYVPELENADPETIHEWHELGIDERGRLAPDYPAPICDHGERREEALAMFKRARGEE